ncbi:shikimate dehydrogenase [Clostridiaceae bacterium 35-E11]
MMGHIKANTRLYAVIGDPIGHSMSPEIHNQIFYQNQQNALYISLKIAIEDLEKSIPLLRDNFIGWNITKPHKQRIIPYLDALDERAKWYQAVNTVKNVNGRMIGYNTDGYGFINSIEKEGINLRNQKVLLIGAGGAARVAAYEILMKDGCLTIANRSIKKAEDLKKELMRNTGKEEIAVCSIEEVHQNYDCIINATPIGMYPEIEAMPIAEKIVKHAKIVYDMIYNPYKTKLLQKAEHYGCKCINGFAMLFYQAVKAQEIWTGDLIDPNLLMPIYEELENRLRREVK